MRKLCLWEKQTLHDGLASNKGLSRLGEQVVMRLGILISHPIQYQSPWFRARARWSAGCQRAGSETGAPH